MDMDRVADTDKNVSPSACLTLDDQSTNWLQSLDVRNEVRFRHLQYRLTDRFGNQLGASINITYNPKTGKYRCNPICDNGWADSIPICERRRFINVVGCVSRVRQMLRRLNNSAEDALDSKKVEELSLAFRSE